LTLVYIVLDRVGQGFIIGPPH